MLVQSYSGLAMSKIGASIRRYSTQSGLIHVKMWLVDMVSRFRAGSLRAIWRVPMSDVSRCRGVVPGIAKTRTVLCTYRVESHNVDCLGSSVSSLSPVRNKIQFQWTRFQLFASPGSSAASSPAADWAIQLFRCCQWPRIDATNSTFSQLGGYVPCG